MISHAEIRHFHMFCGAGGAARGFNKGSARVGKLQAKFRCIGGLDVDRGAVRDFERLSGVPGTVMDLFDRDQYRAFHGCEPPHDWREALPDDIRRAAGYEHPHIIFLSPPCKGFSGLLSETKSRSEKYLALNRLTLRGIWLMLEAYADDPVELIVLENVPRIANRGRALLDQIAALLRSYGYAVAETTHDCGELGGLAQSRKRFLLVARHIAKVPAFLYEPLKRPLRAVGDVLGRMPLPGSPAAGPMHRIPSLQWKTWLRLAFVEAGSDWRSLNRLRVEDGILADYGIIPESTWRDDALGVLGWDGPAGTITSKAGPTNGRFSVADPRVHGGMRGDTLGVLDFKQPSGVITSRGYPLNGRFAVADPRFSGHAYGQYGVRHFDKPMGTVSGQAAPGGGPYAIADPRLPSSKNRHYSLYRIVQWGQAGGCVTGASHAANGRMAVADPRPQGPIFGKYAVTPFGEPAGTVISGSESGQGAYAVADPRVGMNREPGPREAYETGGHYGVLPWEGNSGAISASACHDNGRWSVADPRLPLPAANVVAVIRALDGTWHRPFTTLELAALQSLFDPEEQFELDGLSDAAWRERIGNAVPPEAATAIANVMGEVLLLTWSGETFAMGSTPIWVRPVAAALMAAQGQIA
jgi:site-specific DNA-cytosine methylase